MRLVDLDLSRTMILTEDQILTLHYTTARSVSIMTHIRKKTRTVRAPFTCMVFLYSYRLTIPSGSPPKKYAALKARVRHVPSEVVASKWEVLSEPSQSRLLDLFKAVQRPVLASHHDEKRRSEIQSALAPVVRTLGKRLPRMPFPTNTKDWHFDYEKILEKNVRNQTYISFRSSENV